jgi:hypothetical protein
MGGMGHMVMSIGKKSVLIYTLYIYVFICVFFPLDPYNVKFLFFGFFCLISFRDFANDFASGKNGIIFLMGIIFPLMLFIISSINNGKYAQSISGAYPAVLIILLIPIFKWNIDYEKILCNVLLLEAVITILIAVLDVLGLFNVNSETGFRAFYYRMGMGYMGKSQAYSSYYRIFFKSSPLFIYLLDYGWKKKNKWIVVVSTIALFFSGTRANVLVTFGYLGYRFVFNVVKNKRNQILLALLMSLVTVIFFGRIWDIIVNMMTTIGSVASDSVRSGQFRGLLEELKKPSTLLLGAGLGTEFMDYGRMMYMTGVELSYLDLLRQIGIIFFIPFLAFVMYPLFKDLSKCTKIAHLGYMFIAFTNPLFYTSTAFLAYTYMYYLLEKNKTDTLRR